MNNKEGKQQNRYVIGKEIGSGTFGKVFQATDLKTGRKIAIKQAYQDKKYKNRELEVLSELKNDNLIQLRDHYFKMKDEKKYLYIVMDIFETNLQSLFKELRKEKKKLTPIQVKIMAFQLFKALYYVKKQRKVCHRDLKPPNILINLDTLELRLCDFGSSKIFNQVEKNVTYICSRYYRAPQLLFEYSMYGTEVDVWSAGCILVEFLTREPIFPGDSALEQLIQIIKIIGVPSEQYLKKYANEYSEPLQFPPIPHTNWARILKKFDPEPDLVNLISQILVYDVKKRLNPYQILKHQYFASLTNPEHKKYTQKLPNLFRFDNLLVGDNKKQIESLTSMYSQAKQYKQISSIEKDIVSSIKLQTGDCTPLSLHENDDDNKNQGNTCTKDTIESKNSINVNINFNPKQAVA